MFINRHIYDGKNRVVTELADLSWLWKQVFLVNITQFMNELNLKLQGANSLISDLYTYFKAFELKLTLFTMQLKEKNLAHFLTCSKLKLFFFIYYNLKCFNILGVITNILTVLNCISNIYII
jgi:hypothetical protein